MHVFIFLLTALAGAIAHPNLGVIGGHDAEPGEYPFIVSIQLCPVVNVDCSHKCGGVILSPSWILTAAECVTGSTRYWVLAGVNKLSSRSESRQFVQVGKGIVHPDYKLGGANDIGLLQLKRELTFTDSVKAATLPRNGSTPRGTASFAGWGYQGGLFQYPDALKSADVSIISNEECLTALRDLLVQDTAIVSDGSVCAGPLTGQNVACNKDAGGPLVQKGNVVGIISWYISPCGEKGAPSVFTKVSNYISWINENIN